MPMTKKKAPAAWSRESFASSAGDWLSPQFHPYLSLNVLISPRRPGVVKRQGRRDLRLKGLDTPSGPRLASESECRRWGVKTVIGRKMPFGLARVLGSCYVAWAIVLGGCAQDLNEALMKRVGQEVQWRDLQRDLAGRQPQSVVLEGRIARLKPVDGLIILEDTRLRLTESQNGPVRFTRPGGNVIVTSRGPLNPAIYCLGRSITVVGVLRERPVPPGQDAPELRRNPVIEAERINLGPPSPARMHSFYSFHNPFPPYHHNCDPIHDRFHRLFCD